MNLLNSPVINAGTDTPSTIAEAFEQWLNLDQQIMALLDADCSTGDLTRRQWSIENHAVTLPAVTAQDVWRLLRMTTDESNDGPRSTPDQVVGRAYREAAIADEKAKAVTELVTFLFAMPVDKAAELRNAFAAADAIKEATTVDEAVARFNAAKSRHHAGVGAYTSGPLI